jgi:hypothetical protein
MPRVFYSPGHIPPAGGPATRSAASGKEGFGKIPFLPLFCLQKRGPSSEVPKLREGELIRRHTIAEVNLKVLLN